MDLLMRDVTIQDSELLFEWRNQTEVRMFSRNQGLITKETHAQWLNNRLKLMPNHPFWMFENVLGAIGFVRFDFDSVLNHFEISILINPAFRRKGLGRKILTLAMENCLELNSDSNFFAKAHKKNLGSQSLFLNCGFQGFGSVGDFLVFKRLANHN